MEFTAPAVEPRLTTASSRPTGEITREMAFINAELKTQSDLLAELVRTLQPISNTHGESDSDCSERYPVVTEVGSELTKIKEIIEFNNRVINAITNQVSI